MLSKKFSMIVAVNSLGYIDNGNGGLPWDKHFKSDMERFREVTLNKIVVMGRKTYDSIGKPLPGRVNVVLTRDNLLETDYDKELYVCHDADELNQLLANFTTHNEVVIIGGGEVYNLFRSHYEVIYITEVLKNTKVGTIKFQYPQNGNTGWALAERKLLSDELRFITLVNTSVGQTPKFIKQ